MQVAIAPEKFSKELEYEFESQKIPFRKKGEFLYLYPRTEDFHPLWVRDVFCDSSELKYSSIKDAQKILKQSEHFIYPLELNNLRRQMLISEGLKTPRPIILNEFEMAPQRSLDAFTLISESELLLCKQSLTPFAHGEFKFNENKLEAPSRAYLKLWEFFARFPQRPSKKEVVADFGACPGGWTWVLQKLAKEVIAIDKAAIDPRLLKLPQVRQLQRDGFTLDPKTLGPIDWFFSDIICDPLRLFELVQKWENAGTKNFVCTLKFKGKTDFEAIKKFQQLPKGQLLHLSVNKHELTWIKFS